jgi:hypothetical protein
MCASAGYWRERGHRVPVGEGRVSLGTLSVSFSVGIVLPFGSVLDQVAMRLARLEMLTAER